MLFGSGKPALIRIVGQMTQWNQMISFPITCTAAGQNDDVGDEDEEGREDEADSNQLIPVK